MGSRHFWFSFQLLAETWSVYIVDPAEYSEMDDKNGLTLFETATIYINRRLAPTRVPAILWHEMQHAINCTTRAEHLVPLKSSQEENYVTLVSPVAYHCLASNGFLKLPPLPEM